jgi:hypothetical protein
MAPVRPTRASTSPPPGEAGVCVRLDLRLARGRPLRARQAGALPRPPAALAGRLPAASSPALPGPRLAGRSRRLGQELGRSNPTRRPWRRRPQVPGRLRRAHRHRRLAHGPGRRPYRHLPLEESRRGQSPGNLHAPGRGVRGALSATCSSARVALHSLLRFLSSGGQGETPARSMSCRRTRPVRRPDPGSRSVRAGPALSVLSAPHAPGRSLPSAVPSKGASGGSTPSPFHPSGSVRRAKTTFHRVSQGGSPSRGGRIGRPSVDHSMPLGHFDCCGRRPRQQAESGRPVRTRFAVGEGRFTASAQVPPKVR